MEGDVATVCGNEVFVWGGADGYGIRPFVRKQVFSNYGKARQYAIDFEESRKKKRTLEKEVEVKRRSRKQLKEETAPMTNAIDLFQTKMPSHVTNAKSQAMQNMSGGMAGTSFGNRISIRNSKFRFLQGGKLVHTNTEPTLEVVIFAMANSVQRLYYENPFEPDSKDPPTCFSLDGKVPSDKSLEKQSTLCATCKQNVKGSGRIGNTKACAYKKRVVIIPPENLEGDIYALDVNGQSMFGDQQESLHLYSFKGYYEKLVAHNMDIAAIVTRLSFDDKASVPKIHFTPVRALTAEEFAVVQARMEDPEVNNVLADMTNEAEMEAPKQVQTQPKAVEAPKQQLVQDVAPAVKKGGFPTKGNGQQTTQQRAVPAAVIPTKPIEIDLDKLVNFDDD